ncbi:MAG: CBS domain-containing protein [Labilithrix sp.]|nr:CBS domain-containing protein [Labilithrix sp.]
MPTAGQVCNRRVVVARAVEPLRDVAARMRREHVGSVVVVVELAGHRFPTGVLTDRDIVVGAFARSDRKIDTMTVADVMSGEPVTASEETDLGEVLAVMQSAGVRRIPVVSAAGALVGIVTFDDMLEHVAAQLGGLAQLILREQSTETYARPLLTATAAPKRATRRSTKVATRPKATQHGARDARDVKARGARARSKAGRAGPRR